MESEKNMAGMGSITGAGSIATDGTCRFKAIPKWSIKLHAVYYYRKDFPFQHAINFRWDLLSEDYCFHISLLWRFCCRLRQLAETGKRQKILSGLSEAFTAGDCNQLGSQAAVSIGKSVLLLAILAGGLVLSLIVLLFERCIKRK